MCNKHNNQINFQGWVVYEPTDRQNAVPESDITFEIEYTDHHFTCTASTLTYYKPQCLCMHYIWATFYHFVPACFCCHGNQKSR